MLSRWTEQFERVESDLHQCGGEGRGACFEDHVDRRRFHDHDHVFLEVMSRLNAV